MTDILSKWIKFQQEVYRHQQEDTARWLSLVIEAAAEFMRTTEKHHSHHFDLVVSGGKRLDKPVHYTFTETR